MDVMGTSRINSVSSIGGFMNSLSSAACEWFLIVLLFIDAALSYFLRKFASYCELQTPCPLCSRIDHVFEDEKQEKYGSLLCSNHRMDISSLMYCRTHGNLADSREMCEECLMSFAMQTNSYSESSRLLMGKVGVDVERSIFQNPLLNKDLNSGSLSNKSCSCCNKPWKTRLNAQRLLQLTPIGYGASKANIKPPLPRLPGRSRLTHRDSFKKIREKFSGPVTPRSHGKTVLDPLSHVGYTELKISSDSESEVPFSDDEDGSSMVRDKVDRRDGAILKRGSEIFAEKQSNDLVPAVQAQEASCSRSNNLVSAVQSQEASCSRTLLLDQCRQPDIIEPHHVKCPESDLVILHGSEELNWQQAKLKPNPSVLPELALPDDVSPFSPVEEDTDKPDAPLSHPSIRLALSESIRLEDPCPTSNAEKFPPGALPIKLDGTKNCDVGRTSSSMSTELFESTSTTDRSDNALNVTSTSTPNKMDPSHRLAVSDGGGEVSGLDGEQLLISSSEKVCENSMLFPQGVSTPKTDFSMDDISSPRMHVHHAEPERSDAAGPSGNWPLQTSSSLERYDSGCESVGGSSVVEIEGENVVDRLKRQVEYDRRCIGDLYKELEEERNASAIAANQAMAMITRLQEEKAALHMEALQYLRMMEEQAEYDMEALEKANDLLAEKEKETQDLEAELELYRNILPDESVVPSGKGDNNPNGESTMIKKNGVTAGITDNGNVPFNPTISNGTDMSVQKLQN